MRLGKQLVSGLYALGYFGIGTITLAAQQPLQSAINRHPTHQARAQIASAVARRPIHAPSPARPAATPVLPGGTQRAVSTRKPVISLYPTRTAGRTVVTLPQRAPSGQRSLTPPTRALSPIDPIRQAKPLSAATLQPYHPLTRQPTQPVPSTSAPRFRKIGRAQALQRATKTAPHCWPRRARPLKRNGAAWNATPQVVWQLKGVQPATLTQPQRVVWQGESLPGTQPDYVVNITRAPPRSRPGVPVARLPLSSRVHNVAVAAFTAQPGRMVASQPRQLAAPVLINHLAKKSQQWLNQWGEAEIALQGSRSDRLQGNVGMLLPLQQSSQQLLFTQGGWHRDQEGTLLSLGIGQRWFYSADSYWGYNLFYDHRRHGQHQRLGLGVEQRHSSLIWNLNGYLPLSPRRLVANRADWVRPARGIDLHLQYQPPQQPHWQVNLTTERYFGTIPAVRDHTLQRNPTAVTLGVAYTPLPLVTAGYGFKLGSGRQRSHQLQLTLHYQLGVPLAHQLDPQQVAATHSVDRNRLALVQRNFRMVLQQQPNDEIQLALQPERICQPVGSRVTIALQLHSPRPLEEWRLEWRGDLLQHSAHPSINAAKNQASLILPHHPGTYRLQLIARNARGVVAYSNELLVIAKAANSRVVAGGQGGGQEEESEVELVSEFVDTTSHKRSRSTDIVEIL